MDPAAAPQSELASTMAKVCSRWKAWQQVGAEPSYHNNNKGLKKGRANENRSWERPER